MREQAEYRELFIGCEESVRAAPEYIPQPRDEGGFSAG